MKINTVDLLGITYDEKIICNLIVGLVNNSYNFRINFMKSILEIMDAENFKVEAQTKIGTSKGIPDIVVVAENRNKVVLSIIESKLKANDGRNQTIIYSEYVCVDEILCDREISKHKEIEIKYVYLNLIPDEDRHIGKYISKSYKNLVEDVWVNIEDEGLDRIYKDFCSQMINFYTGLKVSRENKLFDFLLVNNEEEKSFIRFRELMLSLECPENLKVDFFGKIIGKDKVGFISKIVKTDWLGKEARWLNGIYNIDENTYDIHIELIFDMIENTVKINLHYEPNPYVKRHELNEWSTKEGAVNFENRRSKFMDIFYSKIDMIDNVEMIKRNGVNTIVAIEMSLDERITIEEFKKDVTKNLMILAKIVDETFAELSM